jgi:hypothetical protein
MCALIGNTTAAQTPAFDSIRESIRIDGKCYAFSTGL